MLDRAESAKLKVEDFPVDGPVLSGLKGVEIVWRRTAGDEDVVEELMAMDRWWINLSPGLKIAAAAMGATQVRA